MKNTQKEEAKNLFFHSPLNKSEIADKVGVSRKTLLFWSKQGNWDKLKMSAQHTPALVAEKCYYLIDQYASTLLTEGMGMSGLTLKHAQTLHLLASTIRKIKNRNTVSESMEMFNFFLTGLERRDPALAAQIKPEMEEFIDIRSNNEVTDYLLEGFNEDGTIPYPHDQLHEHEKDKRDMEELHQEFEHFLESRRPVDDTTSTHDPATADSNEYSGNTSADADNTRTINAKENDIGQSIAA